MMKERKKIFIIAGFVVIILAVVLICALRKTVAYSKACENFGEKNYQTAAKQFDSLGDYKDSKEKYEKSKTCILKESIDELVSGDPIANDKPVNYYKITEKCSKIMSDEYFSELLEVDKNKIIHYSEYTQFLDYVFNYDESNEILDIECSENPFFGVNLKNFYEKYYTAYEGKTFVATDKYSYYDDTVTSTIRVDTRVILKLKDDDKGFSDSNIDEYLRVYVDFDGSRHDKFSDSTIVPVSSLSLIQVTTDESNLSYYYDSKQYAKEMGGSDVAFVVNFAEEPPTIKYVPEYIENEEIRTLALKKED